MKEEVKLTRTDKRPLAFIGKEIFSGSTKDHDSTRWAVVRVFDTGRGYVVGIAHLTCWDGERDRYAADKRRNIDEVLTLIREQVPQLEGAAKSAISTTSEWTPGKEGKNENINSGESGNSKRDGIGHEDLPQPVA